MQFHIIEELIFQIRKLKIKLTKILNKKLPDTKLNSIIFFKEKNFNSSQYFYK